MCDSIRSDTVMERSMHLVVAVKDVPIISQAGAWLERYMPWMTQFVNLYNAYYLLLMHVGVC